MLAGDTEIDDRPSVVLVDDEHDIRILVRTYLELHGFNVVGEASEGQAGISTVRDLQPDWVILDLQMEGLDGIASLPSLRSSSPDTRILVYSAHTTLLSEKTALRLGASAVIGKDQGLSTLRDTLEPVS